MHQIKSDKIFAKKQNITKFEFNEEVAQVFDDMIERSVPYYKEAQRQIIQMVKHHDKKIQKIYDLGSSTGNLTFALARALNDPNREYIGIDQSPAMIQKSRERLKQWHIPGKIVFECEDILKTSFENADAIICNYTLQFLSLEKRILLLKKIFTGLNKNGLLIVSEKTKPDSDEINNLFTKIHENFKENKSYSKLEIAQKRKALENVLIPFSLSKNLQMIHEAGFRSCEPFLLWNNFVSIVGIK